MNFNQEIKIGDKYINNENRAFIIAEAGVNHNGDIDLAKELVDVAVDSGVDAVKFQTFSAEKLVFENTEKAQYQKNNTGTGDSQYEMLKQLELTKKEHKIIIDYCKEKGVTFLSTPYDEASADLLDDLGIEAYKVSSTDLTNLPFLSYLATKNKPIILSTGMSYLSEVEKALTVFEKQNMQDLIILHCVSNYPVDFEKANLLAIKTLQNKFDALIGYSDHTSGVGAAPYSIPLGVNVIEKHFTLDKNLNGPDHKASLNPKELKKCVHLIRKVEKSLGTGVKAPLLQEQEVRSSLQKSLVSKVDIAQGEVIKRNKLTSKRPQSGISPLYISEIEGQKAKVDIPKNKIIKYDMIRNE